VNLALIEEKFVALRLLTNQMETKRKEMQAKKEAEKVKANAIIS
jgi:hypothetical protein